MSLSEAVMAVVEEMEAEAKDLDDANKYTSMTLRGYARSLRIAVKAGKDTQPAAAPFNPMMAGQMGGPNFLGSPAAQNAIMIEQAKQQLREERKIKEQSLAKQGLGEDGLSTVELVGGPYNGDLIPAPDQIPVGNKTLIAGAVYVMGTNRQAHYSEEETNKLTNPQPTQKSNLILPS